MVELWDINKIELVVGIIKLKASNKNLKCYIGLQGTRTQAAGSPAIHSSTELRPHWQVDARLSNKNLSLKNTRLSSLY